MNYRVVYKDSLEHARVTDSKSQYQGGFIEKNGRKNNSKAYNHDYYMKNKDKWNKNKQAAPTMGSLFVLPTSWVANAVNGVLSLAAAVIDAFGGKSTTTYPFDPNKNTDENKSVEIAISDKERALKNINDRFKYKYKVTSIFGKVRYFYTEAQFSRYLTNLKRKSKDYTIEQDMAAVNPNYMKDKENYDENCAYCTLAYDLRRKGYDVTAISEKNPNFQNPTQDVIESWYEGGEFTHHTVSTSGKVNAKNEMHELFQELASNGDGSSGFLTVTWTNLESGHAMAWQVVDGNAYVLDTQTGRAYTEDEFYKKWGTMIVWGFEDKRVEQVNQHILPSYMRTDNLNVSKEAQGKVQSVDGKDYDYGKDEKISATDKVELEEKEKIGGRT